MNPAQKLLNFSPLNDEASAVVVVAVVSAPPLHRQWLLAFGCHCAVAFLLLLLHFPLPLSPPTSFVPAMGICGPGYWWQWAPQFQLPIWALIFDHFSGIAANFELPIAPLLQCHFHWYPCFLKTFKIIDFMRMRKNSLTHQFRSLLADTASSCSKTPFHPHDEDGKSMFALKIGNINYQKILYCISCSNTHTYPSQLAHHKVWLPCPILFSEYCRQISSNDFADFPFSKCHL